MRAFIVRPFGTKDGIDFDRVERELFAPALARLRTQYAVDVDGGTTGEFIRQGNIREDMFRLLATADLVIADVSIHNPNVFYELGIRHGLQPRHTFLVRERATAVKYPFDLETDRYFVYDAADPAGGVAALAAALRSTLAGGAARSDSPVFQLLPRLAPHDRAALMPVPRDFQDEVEIARSAGERGDLRLLADEAQGFEWESEGLRLVGDAQLALNAFGGARDTFEALRRSQPDDLHANLRLGTIYQRLAASAAREHGADLLARSDLAIRRALDNARSASQRAECLSLLGSNAKTRWIADWRDVPPDARADAALRSPYLDESTMAYLRALREDVAAFYPGANALAMLTMQSGLARAAPDAWESRFDDADSARKALADRDACARRIGATLALALGCDAVLGDSPRHDDPWAAMSRADLALMVSDKPKRVETEYRRAVAIAHDDAFVLSAARRNIEAFRALGLLSANVAAALGVIDAGLARAASPPADEHPARVVLFTGHMIDRPERPPDAARFPAKPEAEAVARSMIERALRAEMAEEGGISLGIAGCACGSDILFHELCESLGVQTRVFLTLPAPDYQKASVAHGGPGWIARYQRLCATLPSRVLQQSPALPRWLADKPGYDLWQRSNRWMMFNAIATGARRLTMVALYNREREPDGPGGAAHLVGIARDWGFRTVELDARELLRG